MMNLTYQIILAIETSAELPNMKHIKRTATNHLTPIPMDYNTSAVN